VSICGIPEEEKFPEAKSFEEIVSSNETLKKAIEHQLLRPEMLLKRIEELYTDNMKARVRRLIDVLDFWPNPDKKLVKEVLAFVNKIPVEDIIYY